MQAAMPTLPEIQHAFYLSLAKQDDEEVSAQVVPDGLSASARLGIYRNTMVSALTNALRLSYPAIERLVGADFFATAGACYIEQRLPHTACLDDYGAELAEFLAAFPPAAALAYLADVARLEWLVNRALQAPNAEPPNLASLGQLSETERAHVYFVPDPSLGLMRSAYPVDRIWRAVLAQDDTALAAIDFADAPVHLLVQRVPDGIDVRRLSEGAWCFTAELVAGHPLHDILHDRGDTDCAALLAEHFAAGRFVAYGSAEKACPAKEES